MERISSVIITLNEGKNIAACIQSVKPFSDDILIVDSFSNDETISICRKLQCRLLFRKFDDFIKQKNYAISKAKFNWIFFIDADERVSFECSKYINIEKINGFKSDAFRISRRNVYLGRHIWYGGWGTDSKYYLFNRKKCRYSGFGVHERLQLNTSKTGRIKSFVYHTPYADLEHHLNKINLYSSLYSRNRQCKDSFFLMFKVIFHPLFKFFKTYFLQCAFLDGVFGFIFSLMASFSVFIKYAKLWESKRLSK